MLKRVDFYTYPNDSDCKELMKFLQDSDVHLVVRDLKERPLHVGELTRLFRHFDMKHFLNERAKSYKKNNLHKELPPRKDLFELMANDSELIKNPIVVSGRLMVIGCNIEKIKEMLQIDSNGSAKVENRNERRMSRTFRPRTQ